MPKNGTVAYVTRLPKCDIHGDHDALYDASIVYNGRRTWAMVCQESFDQLGGHLGLGRGQRLEVQA